MNLMTRPKRVFLLAAVATPMWWGLMAWWATVLPDTILAKVGALVGPVVFLMLALCFAWPTDPSVPYEYTYERTEYDEWAERQRLAAQHQDHLAEQARYLYLAGENTPPTDWFGRN